MKTSLLFVPLAYAALLGANAHAHQLSQQECAEGGDFIRNAALSRQNGMGGSDFLARTMADLAAIKSFPPELRWFVQDQRDEDYLINAVAEVFANPQDPSLHQSRFLADCAKREPVASVEPAQR